jgi:hypothetical protein
MSAVIITSINQIKAKWLTGVLRDSGVLVSGEVESVEFGLDHGNWSTNAALTLTYSDNASGLLPQHLFLKMVDTDTGDGEYFTDSEVRYYRRDYVDVPNAPLLRCFDAAYSAEKHRYHLLLEDVSATHLIAASKKPTLEYGLALAEGLATLHARWWGEGRLEEAGQSLHTVQHIQDFIAIAEPGADPILNRFAPELKPHWPQLLRQLFTHHPQAIIKRIRNPNGFTIIHGDVGHSNVLVPRAADRPIYIIDRQPFDWSLTVWLGVYDLAYAIVLDWDIPVRRQHEIALLRAYHTKLIAEGVADYSWENLVQDYKLCAAMGAYIATEYCRGGVNERWVDTWLPMLKRALTACDDLNCADAWK